MINATTIRAETYTATNEEYHADKSRVSNSMRKRFADSRREYQAIYVTETMPAPPSTKAMDIGTAAHAGILEPHLIERVCVEIPADVLNKDGHRKGKPWTDFKDAHPDTILLTAAEVHQVRCMVDAVYANPVCRKWLEMEGPTEQSIRWQDEETGLPLRCRPDKLTARAAISVKTIFSHSHPKAFARAVENFFYDDQAAFYEPGIAAVNGGEVLPELFIVVSKVPPYVARAYTITEDDMAVSRACVRKTLTDLAECYASGDWREPAEDEILDLVLKKREWRNQWEV